MRQFLFLLIFTLIPSVGFSQSYKDLIKKADTAEKEGKTQLALDAYLAANLKEQDHISTLTKIAKQYGDSMAALNNNAARKEAGERSLAWSRHALKVHPKNSDTHLSVAISLGKLVEFMGNKEKIKTSREIKSEAEKALALNPKSDYAHHLLGRWHQNIADMGGATRMIAQLIYGKVPKGSFQEALDHFAKARKLQPNRLIHELEYGRTLAMLGRKKEAKAILSKALMKPNREPDDAAAKIRARKAL